MLKVPYKKLRLKCKGSLNHNTGSEMQLSRVSKTMLQGIPVLSIFALLGIGMISWFSLALFGVLDLSSFDGLAQIFPSSGSLSMVDKAYAADEVIGDSAASITISGSGSKEQVEAGYGTVTYRSHNVRVQASNVNNYTLNLSGPSTLSTRNKDGSSVANATTITSAGGVTGTTMGSDSSKDNTWGYGYSTDTSTTNEALSYAAPVLSSNGGTNLSVGSIDSTTHNLDSTIKLTFAIKFGNNATSGRYYDDVVLSLVTTPRVLTTYSITYNGNSNTSGAAPAKQEVSVYDTNTYEFTAATQGTLARSGYNFLGWSESSTATSATYAAGSKVRLTQSKPNVTLYAVWQLKSATYTLTLNNNSGTGGPGSQSCTATGTATSCSITISSTKPARSGYTFQGWNTNASGTGTTYQPGGSITISSNTTLWAKWQANSTTFTLTLNANGGSGGPGSQTCSGVGSCSISLSSTKPTRSGYSFVGWNTNASGTGTLYKITESYSISSNTTLYVQWQQVIAWSSMTQMQQMTPEACAGATVGASKTLTDSRDSSVYTVKKVNSTQCWMTQNLRIVNKSISYSDSSMRSGSFTIPSSSTSGFSSNTTANAYYGGNTTYGAYYSWCAATAGSCTSTSSGDAPSSICPKGWYLPVGGSTTSGTNIGATTDRKNDFIALTGKTSASSFTDASLVSGNNINLSNMSLPLAGSYYYSTVDKAVGAGGFYHSRLAYGSSSAYNLGLLNTGVVNASGYTGRNYGLSIRCVAYSS